MSTQYVIQSTVTPDKYFKGVVGKRIRMLEYSDLDEAQKFDTLKEAQKKQNRYYALRMQTRIQPYTTQ